MAKITKATLRKNNSKVTGYASVVLLVTIFVIVVALGNVMFSNRSSSSETPTDTTTTSRTGSSKDRTAGMESASRNSDAKEKADGGDSSSSLSGNDNNNNESGGVSPFATGDVMVFHHTLGPSKGKEAAVVLDMLMVHAYAYMEGEIYGGSCGEGNDFGRDAENSLIEAIGLTKELRFECPRENEYDGRKKMIAYKKYAADGVRAITPEYVDLLKSVTLYPDRSKVFGRDDPDRFTIVVHVKRGPKTTPCMNQYNGYDAYLPNLHYQHLIDKYMRPNARVIIFSQSDSYESFDEFKDRGYELQIDGDIADVWRSLILADVAILSRSSFSYVPAVLAKGTVIYTSFWHKPIRGWTKVGKEVLETTEEEMKRLKATCPVKKDRFAHLRSH